MVGDPATAEGAHQPGEHDHDAGEQAALAGAEVEAPVEEDGQPEGVGREHEVEERLAEDRGPQGRDLHQLEELADAGVVGLDHRLADFFGAAPQRLAHLEGEERAQQARHGRAEEGGAPAEMVGDVAAAGEADGDADRAAGAPDRHHPASLLLREPVREQRGAGGVVAGLADAEHGAADEEVREVAREPGEERRDAPDGDADADHDLAHAAVRPVAEGQRRHGVDEEERGAEQPDQGVAEAELLLDDRRGRRGHPAVHVVEEVDGDHDGEHIPGVAARHAAIMETGGQRGNGYDTQSPGSLRAGSAKGTWRAQRSVKPPRKLWGFDSLPAHQPNFEFEIGDFSCEFAEKGASCQGVDRQTDSQAQLVP